MLNRLMAVTFLICFAAFFFAGVYACLRLLGAAYGTPFWPPFLALFSIGIVFAVITFVLAVIESLSKRRGKA